MGVDEDKLDVKYAGTRVLKSDRSLNSLARIKARYDDSISQERLSSHRSSDPGCHQKSTERLPLT